MIFEKWELEYIKNNYKTKTYSEITLYINQFNYVKKTEHQVRTRASYMKLSKIDTDLDRHYFDSIDNEHKAYWLGFIYADGWISKNGCSHEVAIELGIRDITHLEKFKKCINSRSNISSTHKHLIICNNSNFTDTDTCKIRVYSADMYRGLVSHGITSQKTYDDNFPIIDDGLFRHLLRGYFDGDGCLYINKKGNIAIHITAYSDIFLKHIQKRIRDFGFDSAIYYEEERKSRIYINGTQSDKKRFLDFLYLNSTVYLDRKFNSYNGLAM